eukprot:TRINITY_DN14958_c0_g2_i1.p1 TRINITY_DN14958_c0_g2~~TRINITY_DN14958_c0_g2_i1.p1  ORF type:complete len:508 (-),score=157.39 TRINITY_DN14958_c0_g2_i1:926-2449(-)
MGLLAEELSEGLVELKAQELERAIHIFDAIHKVKKREDAGKGAQMTEELEQKMPAITATLKEAVDKDIPLTVRNAAILKVKEELLRMMLRRLSEGQKHENIWKNMRKEYDSTIDHYQRLVDYLQAENDKNTAEIAELNNKVRSLEDELEKAREQLEGERRQSEELKSKSEQEKESLMLTIANLECETKRLYKTNDSPTKHFKPVKELPIANKGAKALTLRQLKEMILDMYIQKTKYDEKSAANGLPSETMEEYMYVYFNRIYGLKSLVIEAAESIVQGVKKFSSVDSDVALFRRILRNECDEDFRLVFEEIKTAMAGILKTKAREKHRLKTEEEVDKMVKEMQSGEVSSYYWSSIIEQMYNAKHCAVLAEQIKAKAEAGRKNSAGKRLPREEMNAIKSRQEIAYGELVKILLDFQLNTHEKYIHKFTLLFREIDREKAGVVDEAGFNQLLAKMKLPISEEEQAQYIEIIDPHNHRRITYSDCLAFFSSVHVSNTQIERNTGGRGGRK